MADETHSENVGRTDAPSAPTRKTEKVVARGRAARTPFVLLGGVALAIWTVVAIVAIALLAVWWLV